MRALVRRNEAAPLASYIEEILAAEGFLGCETVDVTRRPLTRDLLEGQELVIAAHMPLASAEAEALEDYVRNGGGALPPPPPPAGGPLFGPGGAHPRLQRRRPF